MPYVAMAELKWSIPDKPKSCSVIVKAGDEVCPPVPPRAIQRGVVAFLEHVPGESWADRMAREDAAVAAAELDLLGVNEPAGLPGAEGQVPAGPEAPAPALIGDPTYEILPSDSLIAQSVPDDEDTDPGGKPKKKAKKRSSRAGG